MVAATRYPTRGVRGVASAMTRASRWDQIERLPASAATQEMCVLVQVESVKGLANLAPIAAVEGVDGVFFGPADLAASMGLLGKPADPTVQEHPPGHRYGAASRQGGRNVDLGPQARAPIPLSRRLVRGGRHRYGVVVKGGGRTRGRIQI